MGNRSLGKLPAPVTVELQNASTGAPSGVGLDERAE